MLECVLFYLWWCIMDFSVQNNKEREFFKKDFSSVKELLNRVRIALLTGGKVSIKDLELDGIIDFIKGQTFIYISMFQEFNSPIRWGSCRANLEDTINRDIEKLRGYKTFSNFDIKNSEKCRIMLEYVTEQTPVDIGKIVKDKFTDSRFEPGITGIKVVLQNNAYLYMPTDAWVFSQMTLSLAFNTILRKTYIKDMTNRISERIAILRKTPH